MTVLTTTERFCPLEVDGRSPEGSCFQTHTVFPLSTSDISFPDSITAYVVASVDFSPVSVRVTAGHENADWGPRVCDTVG